MPAPTPFPWTDLLVILALVVLNGCLSMSELAIVSSRPARLEALARAGRRGAEAARQLASDPGRFLSTVQIGITLVGIIAGAYSGANLGGPVAERLERMGMGAEAATQLGYVLVIALTTYASLVIGELVPKQFALRRPEAIASAVAYPMKVIGIVTAPLGWLLDGTSALIFRLLGLRRESAEQVTAEELHLIVAEATRSGVIEESERAFISGAVRLADRPVREVMTPRPKLDWIDVNADEATIRAAMIDSPRTRLPVAEGSVDEILGVVQARDITAAVLQGRPLVLAELMRDAPVVFDQLDAMDVLQVLREAAVPMALVHDEYGHFEGIVTPADLLAAMGGAFASDRDPVSDPDLFERDDGSFLVSGSHDAAGLADRLDIQLPEDRDYATVAGFALAALRHLPTVGECFEAQGWRFEIVDMDERKIDKLLVSAVG